jgi:hypothetical protein
MVCYVFFLQTWFAFADPFIAGWIPTAIETRSTSRSSLDPDRLLLLSLVQMVANRKWPGMEQGGNMATYPKKMRRPDLGPQNHTLELLSPKMAQKGRSKAVKLIKNAYIC